jgi:hypothetical protein
LSSAAMCRAVWPLASWQFTCADTHANGSRAACQVVVVEQRSYVQDCVAVGILAVHLHRQTCDWQQSGLVRWWWLSSAAMCRAVWPLASWQFTCADKHVNGGKAALSGGGGG